MERGVSNTLMGWMEAPRHIDIQGRNHGAAAAAIVGPIQGVGAALARTTAGVFETLTFPFPLTNRFEKLGEPEMVLDKAGSGSGKA